MFVKTIKLKKPSPIAIVIILAALFILIAIWVLGFGSKGIGDKYKLTSNAERTKFLTDLGWKVSAQEVNCKVVKIPSTFNKIYEVYNRLQKEQGFDLSDDKGKTVEIYTYEVYNYPNKPKNIQVHLIISEGTLIGGDVCSNELEGFMQGLMPVNKGELKNSGSSEANNATTTVAATDKNGKPVTTVATTDKNGKPVTTVAATDKSGKSVTTVAPTAQQPASTTTAATKPGAVTTAATTKSTKVSGTESQFIFTKPQN